MLVFIYICTYIYIYYGTSIYHTFGVPRVSLHRAFFMKVVQNKFKAFSFFDIKHVELVASFTFIAKSFFDVPFNIKLIEKMAACLVCTSYI